MDIVTRLKNMCARREYCTSDIMTILHREGVTGGEASMILDDLKDGRWMDDARYAGCYAREKSSVAGWGAAKIKYHLSMKGIPSDVISSALGEIDGGSAAERMKKVLEAKWREVCRAENDVTRRRTKLLRFALGRGYSVEDALSVIKDINNQNN